MNKPHASLHTILTLLKSKTQSPESRLASALWRTGTHCRSVRVQRQVMPRRGHGARVMYQTRRRQQSEHRAAAIVIMVLKLDQRVGCGNNSWVYLGNKVSDRARMAGWVGRGKNKILVQFCLVEINPQGVKKKIYHRNDLQREEINCMVTTKRS